MTADRLRIAMESHTNLNTFEAVVAILEGGGIYRGANGSADKTASKIIALCKAEEQRQLTHMDKATGRTS